ncbi:MAG: hypothetical protein AAGG11_13650 [Pseudomonadota bacterium]
MMRTPGLCLLAAAITTLVGCSSGSDSDTPPPPVSESAAAPTVVLTGFVTDNPIQDATVTATVAGQTFTSDQPSASDGSYQIEISSTDPDALVRLEAVDLSGTTRLSAIVDSFEAIEEAVEDTSEDEDFNITNITTAQEVLATRLTEDGSIDSKEELVETVARVETEDLLEVSAAIKLVVDGIDGVVLPTGVEDTLDLAEAIVSGESTFLDDVEEDAPGALDSAVDLVLSDGNATVAFETASVPGVYIAEDSFSIFAFFAGGFGFAQPEGEGSAGGFDWQLTEAGVLNLFLGGPNPGTEQVTLLSRTDDIVNVVVREDGDSGAGDPSTARYYAFGDGFTPESVPGSYSTINDPGVLTVFEEGGTGYDMNALTGVAEGDFNWAVDSAGVLTITDADGATSTVYRLAGSTDDNLLLFVVERDAAGSLAYVGFADVLRTDAELGSDAANGLLLAGSTYAMTEPTEKGLFSFGTDGSFQEILQRQEDDGSWIVGEDTGSWSVDATGEITILFPGETQSDGAQIVQGLGQDFMVVEPGDDSSGVIQVMRVRPLELDLIAGRFMIQDEVTGVAAETVSFNPDFTGIYIGADGVGEEFTWGLSEGRLVLQSSGDNSFDDETATFYLLPESNGDLLRFLVVRRVNGVLEAFDPSTGEVPDTLMLLSLIRNLP